MCWNLRGRQTSLLVVTRRYSASIFVKFNSYNSCKPSPIDYVLHASNCIRIILNYKVALLFRIRWSSSVSLRATLISISSRFVDQNLLVVPLIKIFPSFRHMQRITYRRRCSKLLISHLPNYRDWFHGSISTACFTYFLSIRSFEFLPCCSSLFLVLTCSEMFPIYLLFAVLGKQVSFIFHWYFYTRAFYKTRIFSIFSSFCLPLYHIINYELFLHTCLFLEFA